ncbi:hypothetical protein GF352_04425 [archaeon]|nr:hypothetical protein [archaeon]
MNVKPVILLTIPLMLVVLVFGFFSSTKNPRALIDNAQLKLDAQENLLTDSLVVMDLSIMDSVMRYVSNMTTAIRGGEVYTKITTQTPFSDYVSTDEQFMLEQGNFSCTDSLVRPVCVRVPEPEENFNELLDDADYKNIEYLGTKTVNQTTCDAIFADVNASVIDDLGAGALTEDVEGNFSEIKEVFLYSCLDPSTGISLESVWGIMGETSFGSLIVDIGVNITKTVNSFSNEVPESLFILPYEVVSQDEYEVLVNQTELLAESQNTL